MTKKTNPKTTLVGRALAVVESDAYDIDARERVKVALANLEFYRGGGERGEAREAESELRDLVTRAERGECLSRLEGIDPECVEGARATLAYINLGGVPDCLTTAAMLALDELASRVGADIWHDVKGEGCVEDGGYSLSSVARLFQHHLTARLEFEPKKDLAELVSAVLAHEDTPPMLRRDIRLALSELFHELGHANDRITDSAGYIKLLLGEHARSEKGGEG